MSTITPARFFQPHLTKVVFTLSSLPFTFMWRSNHNFFQSCGTKTLSKATLHNFQNISPTKQPYSLYYMSCNFIFIFKLSILELFTIVSTPVLLTILYPQYAIFKKFIPVLSHTFSHCQLPCSFLFFFLQFSMFLF